MKALAIIIWTLIAAPFYVLGFIFAIGKVGFGVGRETIEVTQDWLNGNE